MCFFCRPCRRVFCCVQLQMRFFVVRMFLLLSAVVFRSPMPMLTDSGCLRSFLAFCRLPRRHFAATRAYRRFTLGAERSCACRRSFSQQMRRNFSRFCSIIAFLTGRPPLLSALDFAVLVCKGFLYLFASFCKARRIFSRLCSIIAFLAKRTPAAVCVDRHIFLPSERSCNFLCFSSSPALVLIYGRFMFSDRILLLIKREPFFSCECHCDRPMVAPIIRFFLHKTRLVLL